MNKWTQHKRNAEQIVVNGENDDNSDADVQIINKSTKLSVHAPLSNTPVKHELAKDPRPTKANNSQTSSQPVGKGQKSTVFTQMSTLLQGQLEVQQEGLKLQREARAARVQAEKEAKEAKEATDALEFAKSIIADTTGIYDMEMWDHASKVVKAHLKRALLKVM